MTPSNNKAPLSLPPAIANYALAKSKTYWLFLEKHTAALEADESSASTIICKEAEGALQALADVFGLPALKAALEAYGETCPVIIQQTDERLVAKY